MNNVWMVDERAISLTWTSFSEVRSVVRDIDEGVMDPSQLEALEDIELVEMTLGGQSDAFGTLYDRYQKPMLRYALRRTHGKMFDAEELVHECFTKALAKLTTFRKESPFPAWLTSILRRLIFDWSAGKQGVELFENSAPSPEGDPADVAVDSLQFQKLSTCLTECLHELPARERRMYHLLTVEEFPHRDVAELFALSEANCRQIFSRVRKSLAQCLELKGITRGGSA